LVGFVRRRIDDAADRDAEDIVQDVMLNLFDKADFAAPIENLSAYIYQSLRNRITDMLRKRRDTSFFRELVQLSADDTEKVIEKKQIKAKIYDAIDALSEDQRAVVIATEFENRSFRELSEEWRIPIGTLLARKSRALKNIKKELTGSV
jgi:RNA polymerase sigma-70 factor (ECF subfamily)